eukprot:1160926-Pelagomonas_calceolata.AAC.2
MAMLDCAVQLPCLQSFRGGGLLADLVDVHATSSATQVRANLFKNVKKSGTVLDKQGGGRDFAKPPPAQPKQEKKRRDDGGGLSGVIQALDFSAPRSKGDAEILYETKDNWKSGQSKMTREQYAALRRKIGEIKCCFPLARRWEKNLGGWGHV